MRPITHTEPITPAPAVVAPPELAPESVARREKIDEPMEEGDADTDRLEIATEATTPVRLYSQLLLSV